MPAFHPDRLDAPQDTPVPKTGNTRVFVCSAGELFGPWILDEWIERVFAAVRAAPQWTFLFLTKFPSRLPALDWPKNAWIGCTIDRQERVPQTTDAFVDLHLSGVKNKLFISCEPLLEDLDLYPELMGSLNWIIVGALSKGIVKVQPNSAWVNNILREAELYDIPIWFKDNLIFRPQEVPYDY
ncbi:MAG: hypothetical protein BA864_05050 [Desulfuromonadales bacterium C00003093]|nr:MAG: hypothetical protein BA864_05050 [Desulfuromonadales bacterium C00003093]